MSNLPVIMVAEAAYRDDINRAFEPLGYGTAYLTTPVCPGDIAATPSTPATAYICQDMSAQNSNLVLWTEMAAGNLPTHIAWGQDGVISEAEAIAACSNLRCHAAGNLADAPNSEGIPTVTEWRESVFALENIQLIPMGDV